MSKEYTYDIDKYTIGVDENGEGGIGMTVAKIENGELHLLGNCYGENARCIDLLIKENQELKGQIDYLRSGEYINQLKFERDMLQNVFDKGEVSEEDKTFIDCTHRNTELLEEIKRLHNDKLEYLTEYAKMSSSQDKFIKYLEDESRKIYRDCGLRQNIFKQVLQKYEEIIGDDKS